MPATAAAAARLRDAARSWPPRSATRVMLKASWGGGGRGMRVIESEAQLAGAVAAGAPRSAGRLRQRRGVPGEAGAPRAPRRSADPRRHARQPGAPVRARLHRAAAQPESGRARAGALSSTRRAARRAVRSGADDRPRRRLQQRRHRRVPAGRRQRPVLLHRGEPAHPGRAHRHRDGHRHRHRQGADPHRRQARASATPDSGVPAQADIRLSGARAAVPHHHRGSGEQLHARLRPPHRLPQPRRLRRAPRRRHRLHRRRHHALLRFAAGEGHRLGADAARKPIARMHRALWEFRIRGVVTNLRFLDQRHHASALRARPTTPRASSTRRRSCSARPRAATAPRASCISSATSSSTATRRCKGRPAPARVVTPRLPPPATRLPPPAGSKQTARRARPRTLRAVDAGSRSAC